MKALTLGGMVGLAALLASAGCGKPVLRIADPSLGDYYTDQEFRKLRSDQRDEYCAELARQDSAYRAEIAETRAILDEIASRRPALLSEVDSLAALADSAEARLAQARAGSASRPDAGGGAMSGSAATSRGAATSHSHRVRSGESLWRISALDGVYGDGRKWPRLYEANKGTIRDPDRIYPGQELVIPHE